MPYVRTHGNQVTIVHGERNKATSKVQQRTLFTFYSKKEAAAAIGDGDQKDSDYFQYLLCDANPGLKFNWGELAAEIREHMEVLPDIYPVRKARSEDSFEKALNEFARHLIISDPQSSTAGKENIKRFADDLTVIQNLISMRQIEALRPTEPDNSPWAINDGFCWKYELQGHSVPSDFEDYATSLYQSGKMKEAKRLFALLVRCFPNFAEGYNYLGLIALAEDNPKLAVEHFRTTAKLGRSLFPPRMAKASYWSDLSTRPYIRGLMNLALSLNQAQQYKETLIVCDQLKKECGFKGAEAAAAHRALACLNLHYWSECVDAAKEIAGYHPSEGFTLGFALFELGRHVEAAEWFLHASLNDPHSAHMLVDLSITKPKTYHEVEDHNSGISLIASLPRFFKTQSKASSKFFHNLIANPEVKSLLAEVMKCSRDHSDREKSTRESFLRWTELKDHSFAQKKAKELGEILGYAKPSLATTAKTKKKSK